MRKILISRNGAYGDIIHMTHLPRLLKENGWDYVGVSTGFKGKQLLEHNPFIDIIHFFEPGGRSISVSYFHTRNNLLSEMYDETINLHHSLEYGALALEGQNEYYQHQKIREKRGHVNYYDVATDIAGYPELRGKYKGEVFFTDEEERIVKHDLLRPGRFKDNFKVMINLAGSGPHKVFVNARDVAKRILDKYPEAIIFTTGSSNLEELDFKDLSPRIHSLLGKRPFRQSLHMAKYMDCVIGCESGIMCGASMFDVPTIQLMTAAAIKCHCKYATKDYSLQSPAKCSPCYKGPYKYYGCPQRNGLPICVYFDTDAIIKQVGRIYEEQYLSTKTS
jgi:ADP-heptose:LPS heptosyltransferase